MIRSPPARLSRSLSSSLPIFVTNALENKPLPVYRRQNKRDWIFVDDHCAALDLLLTAKGVEGEVFNIGSSQERSAISIGQTILEYLGKPASLLKHVEDRPGHVKRHAVDTTKLRRKLGWSPKKSFEEGLRETIEWYKANDGWWRPIKEGTSAALTKSMTGADSEKRWRAGT